MEASSDATRAKTQNLPSESSQRGPNSSQRPQRQKQPDAVVFAGTLCMYRLSMPSERALPITTDCSAKLTRCISTALSASFHLAWCRKRSSWKSAQSSRLSRDRMLSLKAAVTPSRSSYALRDLEEVFLPLCRSARNLWRA